jgi:pyruvate,orthophosphate dikinase
MNKLIYYFGLNKLADGSSEQSGLLGSKGANLAEMSNMGMPVPSGFTISTELCKYYYDNQKKLPDGFSDLLIESVRNLENTTGKIFGSSDNPLLLSVRSGAAVSMPGMMDTVLNLGINDNTIFGLANNTGNPLFAKDSYMRFLQMYGSTVLGIKGYIFEDILESLKVDGQDFSIQQIENVIKAFKKIILASDKNIKLGNPYLELEMAVIAVLNSWMSERAIAYRKIHNISEKIGTGITVQSMVFGNMGSTSGTGVVFTRSPSTGENKIFGEFLLNAQGEDIVSGAKTPMPIENLENILPDIYVELKNICKTLENHYKDPQDI